MLIVSFKELQSRNYPECGTRCPEHDTRHVPYTYKGQAPVIPAIAGHFCTNCDEVTLDHEAVDRYGDLVGVCLSLACSHYWLAIRNFFKKWITAAML